MSIVQGLTAHLRLKLPNFDVSGWEPAMRENLVVLDAALSEFLVNNQVKGVWQNSTAYASGDVLVDATNGSMWVNGANHTSAATGTFAEDRANTGNWTAYNSRFGQSEGLAVTPEQFGASLDDPLEDVTTAVQAAINEAMQRGVALQLDRIYVVNGQIIANMDDFDTLRIRGNGGFLCSADLDGEPLLSVVATPASVWDITSIDNAATRDFGAQGNLTDCAKLVIVDNTLEAGRFAKLVSEDVLSVGSTANKGEVVYIAEVDGDDVYLSARLRDTYTTNPRLAVYRDNKKVYINEITITNDWDALVANSNKVIGIGLEGLVAPLVDGVIFKNISIAAIRTIGCMSASIVRPNFARAYNSPTVAGILGYGLDDRASEFTQLKDAKAFDVRHAFTTNTITSDIANPWTYGTTYEPTISNCAAGTCSSAPWDTHDRSIGATFVGCRSYGVYQGQDVAYGGFQLRGKGHRVLSCEHYGAGVGILIDHDDESVALTETHKHTIVGFVYDGDNYAIRASIGASGLGLVYAHLSELQARTTYQFGVIRAEGAKLTIEDAKITHLSTIDNRRVFDLRGDAEVVCDDINVDFSLAYNAGVGERDSYLCTYQEDDNSLTVRNGTIKAGVADWDALKYVGAGGATDITAYLELRADKASVSVDGLHTVSAGSDIRRHILVDEGRSYNSAYREQTISSGTSVILSTRGCSSQGIVWAINSTHASANINGIEDGHFVGQTGVILCLPGSTQDLFLDATPANQLSLLADLTLDPGAGTALVWNGQTWLGYSASITAGAGTGVTDHGALTGLGDDDHTQYHTDARAVSWLATKNIADLGDVPAIGTVGQVPRVNSGATALTYRMPAWDVDAYNVIKVVPATHDSDISGASLADTATASVYAKAGATTNTAQRLFAGADKGRFAEFIDHAFKIIGRISESSGGLIEMRFWNAAGAAIKAYIGGTFQVFGGDSGNRNGTNQVTIIGGLYADSIDGPSPAADYLAPILIGAVRLWDDGTKLRAKRGSDPANATDGTLLY